MSNLAMDTRHNSRNKIKNWYHEIPFHSVLIALYICLYSYDLNKNEVFFRNVIPSIIFSVITAIILVAIIWIVLKNSRLAGIISSLIIVYIVFYGHFYDYIYDAKSGLIDNYVFLPLWVSSFLIVFLFVFIFRSRLKILTVFLNIFTLVLVLMPIGSLILNAAGEIGRFTYAAAPKMVPKTALAVTAPNRSEYPEIFYLIFDRYAGNRTLNEVYKYNNGAFLDHLSKLGFYIVDRSRANYTVTMQSLASSLNLRHLTYLSERIGTGSSDEKPVLSLLQDHEVARFLKARGYRFIHLGSWWEPTRKNLRADEIFTAILASPWANLKLNEFESLLVEPLLPTRLLALFRPQSNSKHRRQFFRVRRKFEKLAARHDRVAPRFVFAHILLPHSPFVFFADGRYKTAAEAEAMSRNENYIDQLKYANRKIKELVHRLHERKPQPIIIIQSDEGPFPARYVADRLFFDWSEATAEELRQKFGILNVIYFPDRAYGRLYEAVTPVNTFRIVFNKYFGQNFPLLPDTSYSHFSYQDLYSFFDVTETVE